MNTNANGLGLHICKRLAAVLDADLFLADEYNQGCQFVLKLKLKIRETLSKQATYKLRGGHQFGKKKQPAKRWSSGLAFIYEL